MKKKIGITGQVGFIGTHLANHIQRVEKEYELLPFKDNYFTSPAVLKNFINRCDVVVHLAAMNRGDEKEIYECNISLVRKLIEALTDTGSRAHVLFASSTQEEGNSLYGRSKREGRELLAKWAKKHGARFTGLIIPNVYGPFCEPFYNSAVATFCCQLTHKKKPEIHVDAHMKLIYINHLVKQIDAVIRKGIVHDELRLKPTGEGKVSDILILLEKFKSYYIDDIIIPPLKGGFAVSLFNTFRSYIDSKDIQREYTVHADKRGSLFETMKSYTHGQSFFSKTRRGITRGNHYHLRKIERFCVVNGNAEIKLRRIGTKKVLTFKATGKHPSFIDIPVFFTHNITNSGKKPLHTLFWTNEIFDPKDPDMYYEEV
ncbi:NAD-dependent epimerase/dehydratase family protein [Spirochaetota bacterium]